MSDESNAFQTLQRIAGPVSRETFGDLLQFIDLFLKWNARINLAAAFNVDNLWNRHVLDSAQLWPLRRDIRWLDLGSGGGFPGLVLAILMKHTEGNTIELIESNMKKAAFLRAAISQLNLPARVTTGRIQEQLPRIHGRTTVTARALAPLVHLLELAAPLLTTGNRALFHKGRDYRREISECRDRWSFEVIEHTSLIESQSVILDISNVRMR